MDYVQLKDIVSVKSFNIIHQLINKPKLELYLKSYTEVEGALDTTDPYSDDVTDFTSLVSSGNEFIAEVDCIYTFDKTLILEADQSLGSKSSLTVYMRFDDVPPIVLENKNSIIIKFNGTEYETDDIQNAYGIIIQANLTT